MKQLLLFILAAGIGSAHAAPIQLAPPAHVEAEAPVTPERAHAAFMEGRAIHAAIVISTPEACGVVQPLAVRLALDNLESGMSTNAMMLGDSPANIRQAAQAIEDIHRSILDTPQASFCRHLRADPEGVYEVQHAIDAFGQMEPEAVIATVMAARDGDAP